jgi:hypothetical protein
MLQHQRNYLYVLGCLQKRTWQKKPSLTGQLIFHLDNASFIKEILGQKTDTETHIGNFVKRTMLWAYQKQHATDFHKIRSSSTVGMLVQRGTDIVPGWTIKVQFLAQISLTITISRPALVPSILCGMDVEDLSLGRMYDSNHHLHISHKEKFCSLHRYLVLLESNTGWGVAHTKCIQKFDFGVESS